MVLTDSGNSTAQAERIPGYDVARSMALLGMIIVHFSLVMAADSSRPTSLASLLDFLDGRAAATFVVLAGIGLSLLSRRALASVDPESLRNVGKLLVHRGLFLLVLGFINLSIWPGDILRVYGVSLLLASLLLNTSNRGLLFGAFAFALGFVALFLVFDFEKNWDWSTLTYRELWTFSGLFRNMFYDGFRSVFPWTGFVLFGMWLGRLDMRSVSVWRRVLLSALSVLAIAETTSWLCVRYFLKHPHDMDQETITALFGTQSMPALPLFLLASGATAVIVIALCVKFVDAWPSNSWRPLIATGQMALTWYFGHIVFGLGTVVAFELEASQSLPVAMACGVLFFALAVLLSWLWKMAFRHGPLEWIMRKIAG